MKDIDLVKFGNNLRIERLKQKYTQEQLEELSGVLAQHIGRIEKGEIDIRLSTLISLLKALNIKFEELYDIENH